jgi:3-oxoacyl-[acyl-carrier protein] reductase
MSQRATAARTAIVTGASRGIGRAIAAALGSRRFNVAVNYFNNADAAAETVAMVKQAGGQAVAVQADVGRAQDRQRLVDETVKAFGDIHVLVNNAGIPPSVRADVLDTTEDVYDRVMDTNLKGPFFLTQLVARRMIEQAPSPPREPGVSADSAPRDDATNANLDANPRLPPGASAPVRAIINIGSVSGYAVTVNRSQYCIAKAGLRMMTQLFAARLAGEGVGVFEVCPGVIDTDMARGAKERYDKLIHEEGLLPIARWGRPDDVARAVLAIVDGYFPYSTGGVIDVDGGYHVRRL